MFPPPPHQDYPTGPGPMGLEAAVSKLPMFATSNPLQNPMAPPEDPYANLDIDKLKKRFETARKDGQDLRWVFERQWWRNLLYVLGRQWVFFDSKRNEWRDKRLKKWIPKPVTNKLREVVQSIRAMFAAVKLGTIVRPNGSDPKNITAANTSDELQPIIHEEHQMDRVFRDGDFWLITLGNVFYYCWWDTDPKYGSKPIEHDQCLQCQTVVDPAQLENPAQFMCPQCGGTQSQPIQVDEVPIGRGCTDVVSPFEVLLPSHAADFNDCRKIIRVRWRTRDYIEDRYPELAIKIAWEKAPTERSLHLFKSLAAQNDLSTTPFTWGSGQRAEGEGITEYEYWEQPSREYAKGLFFKVLGESNPLIIEDETESSPGPIPTETIKGDTLWPWIHAGYEQFGGRMWATGALDPLIQKQDALNQLDSLIQLTIQRMANPIWLEPKGAEVEKFTGEPGLVVRYSMVGVNGLGKPERIPGEGPHASLFTIREQYLRDIEELAGTYDVIKGQQPTGVEAFSALQLLVERSQSRFTTAFNERGEAYRKWFSLALELERKYGPNDRVMATLGPNQTWTFKHFQQANLQGDVSIVVEDGSNVPKTSLGKRAAMEQANNLRLIDPSDPDQRRAILSDFGLTHLMPGLDSSVKAALRDQDAFEQWAAAPQGPSPLTIMPWDDPNVRMNELRKWANSDRMQELMHGDAGQLVTQILSAYFDTLSQMLAFQMMQQAGGAGMPPADPNGGTPGNGNALNHSNNEAGSTDNVPSGHSGKNQGQGPA